MISTECNCTVALASYGSVFGYIIHSIFEIKWPGMEIWHKTYIGTKLEEKKNNFNK